MTIHFTNVPYSPDLPPVTRTTPYYRRKAVPYFFPCTLSCFYKTEQPKQAALNLNIITVVITKQLHRQAAIAANSPGDFFPQLPDKMLKLQPRAKQAILFSGSQKNFKQKSFLSPLREIAVNGF